MCPSGAVFALIFRVFLSHSSCLRYRLPLKRVYAGVLICKCKCVLSCCGCCVSIPPCRIEVSTPFFSTDACTCQVFLSSVRLQNAGSLSGAAKPGRRSEFIL